MNKVLLTFLTLSVACANLYAGAADCGRPKGTGFYVLASAGGTFGSGQITLPKEFDLWDTQTAVSVPADNTSLFKGQSFTSSPLVSGSLTGSLKSSKGSAIFRVNGGYDYTAPSGFTVGGEFSVFVDTTSFSFAPSYAANQVTLYVFDPATPGFVASDVNDASVAAAGKAITDKTALVIAKADTKTLYTYIKGINDKASSPATLPATAADFFTGDKIATSSTVAYGSTPQISVKRTFGCSLTGRVGYLARQALIYVKGGVNISNWKSTSTITDTIKVVGLSTDGTAALDAAAGGNTEIGRASCRERV